MSRSKRDRRQAQPSRPRLPGKLRLNGSLDLRAFAQRFPVPGRLGLGFALASIVFGNAYLLWQIWHGYLSATGLIVLVAAEGVLLSILEAAQRSLVPPGHRMEQAVQGLGLPQKLLSWIGFVVGVLGAYLLWIFILHETELLIGFCTSVGAWRSSGLDIAVGLTLLFALSALSADQRHYRQAGPPLVSTVSMEAMSRRMTFIYGALVFALPFVGLFALAIFGIVKAVGGRAGKHWNLVGGVASLAAFYAIFFLLATAVDSGPRGWAAVYLLGKILVEALFALMPVFAKRATTAAAQDASLPRAGADR